MAQDGSRPGFLARFLNKVEYAGNKLPQPVTLFLILIAFVLIASWVASMAGVVVVRPGTTGEEVRPVNLLSGEQIQRMLVNMTKNFTDFPPLGVVLVVMLGIGVAERTGLIAVGLRAFVSWMPSWLITIALVTAGQLSSIAADAGYIVLVPLGAAIFWGMGRHPLAGLAAAFAGVSGGFGANVIITSLDPLLAGFTQTAARIVSPEYVVDPTANWWIMATLVPVTSLAGWYVTERIVEPRLGKYKEIEGLVKEDDRIKPEEKKGLAAAVLVVAATLALVAWMAIPSDGILRDADGGIRPLLDSIVPLMMIIFILPGIVYGLITKTIRSDKDAAKMTADSMASMGGYVVLAFVAAQFVAFFNWSNLGIITAIAGADALKAVNLTGIPLIVAFVLVASLVNIVIGSASAKWAIMAPIFVPMFMLMGYSPELTQAAYRIGDSYTNILTPLLPYFPLIITFAQKYVKETGIGTIIALMLPYSIAIALVRIPVSIVWMLLELPLGPGAPMHYTP
ncbi:MAG TPA: aminobenzoyl-glutamate transporter [Planctomycetaceae bacterium]|nr:aminobenzoyl-glutamate transporter [Planctomycetaceae bacterium]